MRAILGQPRICFCHRRNLCPRACVFARACSAITRGAPPGSRSKARFSAPHVCWVKCTSLMIAPLVFPQCFRSSVWERDTRVPGPVRAARASLLPPRPCACPTQANFSCASCDAFSWVSAPFPPASSAESLQISASPSTRHLARPDVPRIVVRAAPLAARTATRHSWIIASARILRTLPWGEPENFTRKTSAHDWLQSERSLQ
jgi:hypothetical protein